MRQPVVLPATQNKPRRRGDCLGVVGDRGEAKQPAGRWQEIRRGASRARAHQLGLSLSLSQVHGNHGVWLESRVQTRSSDRVDATSTELS
uniref:Uncharacterized protein n=1 Tax=Leersia perrieri TaxID=77586 RepID=A0A0D9VQA0_9ORYZ